MKARTAEEACRYVETERAPEATIDKIPWVWWGNNM